MCRGAPVFLSGLSGKEEELCMIHVQLLHIVLSPSWLVVIMSNARA